MFPNCVSGTWGPFLSTVAIALLTLLGTLASIAFYLIRRRDSRVDDPKTIRTNELSCADAAIAAGPQGIDDVNRQLEAGVAASLSGADRAGVAVGGVSIASGGGDSGGPGGPVRDAGVDQRGGGLLCASGTDDGNPPGSQYGGAGLNK